MSNWYPTSVITHLWFPLFVFSVILSLSVHSWQFRKEPGAKTLTYAQLCKCLWIVFMMAGGRASTAEHRMFWDDCWSAAAYLCALLWPQFVAELCGLSPKYRRLITWINSLIVGAVYLAMLADPWLHWYISDYRLQNGELWMRWGWTNNLSAVLAYLMCSIAIFLNVRWIVRSRGLRRRQATTVLLAGLMAMLGHFLTLFDLRLHVEQMPITLLTSALLISFAFHRWRFLGVVPLAQETALKTMIDGLVVIDDQGNLVEMNSVAQQIFTAGDIHVGARYEELCRFWPELIRLEDNPSILESRLFVEGKDTWYQIRQTELRVASGIYIGRVVIFKDVTHEKQQQMRLIEQEKALAMLRERQRLGRELHDGHGQAWSFLSLKIHVLQTLLSRGLYAEVEEQLKKLDAIIRERNTGFRESLVHLHSAGEKGLLASIEDQLQWYKDHCNLETEMVVRGRWEQELLAADVEAQLLRIVQEAMVNVRKSASARHLRVVVTIGKAEFRIAVEDDGQGFEPGDREKRRGHLGLSLMEDRATEVFGTLQIDSAPGKGTTISVSVPLLRNSMSGSSEGERSIETVR